MRGRHLYVMALSGLRQREVQIFRGSYLASPAVKPCSAQWLAGECPKEIRNLLVNCGVKDIYEAGDGITALDTLRTVGPDVVLLDWEMPLLNGAELVRIVRSPGVFPMPDVPIIMLSSFGERWRVLEAAQLGVNEYLIKPVSAKAIYDRLVSITLQPRPTVRLGDYYGPEPRKLATDAIETVDEGPSLVPNALG